MKANSASLLNAIGLIVLSLWGYLTSDPPSVTAIIPSIVGIILLLCFTGVKNENKVIAHIAVLLTLVILFALIMVHQNCKSYLSNCHDQHLFTIKIGVAYLRDESTKYKYFSILKVMK